MGPFPKNTAGSLLFGVSLEVGKAKHYLEAMSCACKCPVFHAVHVHLARRPPQWHRVHGCNHLPLPASLAGWLSVCTYLKLQGMYVM